MQIMRWVLVFICLSLPFSGYATAEEAQEFSHEVSVKENELLQERSYSVRHGSCEITWTLYRNELNREVIKHRSQCSLPLEGQAGLLDSLLGKILKDPAIDWPLKTLFWGRIAPDFQKDTVMSRRLAQAAFQSSLWDNKKGRPVKGHENECIRKLSQKEGIYPELDKVFQKHGLALKVSGVEKVLVTEASRLPYFSWLETRGVLPTDRLPYDFLLWFSITGKVSESGDPNLEQ